MKNPAPSCPVIVPIFSFIFSFLVGQSEKRGSRLEAACVLLAFGLGVSAAQAQMTAVIDTAAYKPGGIEGYVLHALTGRPVAGAAIGVLGTPWTSRSGSDGRFWLRNIFPGTRSLTIEAEGMRSICISDVAIQPGRTVRLRPVDLRPQPIDGVELLRTLYINADQLALGADDYAMALVPLAQVVVVPSHYELVEEAVTAGSDLNRDDLELLPQKGEDLYRAITHLPGLATADTATRFWVRGAPNDQMLTRLDGVELLEPFHIKGFDGALSIVDLETLGRLDLVTGGFTAKYGDRMAGVLTMETEIFDPARPRNTLAVSLTGARAVNRGEFGEGRGSWLVEGRNGYPDLFVGQAGQDGEMKTRYSDFTAKIGYRLNPDQDISLHYLHGQDSLRFNDVDTPYLKSDYGSDYLWGRWRGKFGERVFGETVLSLASLWWRHREVGTLADTYAVSLKDNRALTTLGLRQDWTVVLSDRALVQAGFEAKWGKSKYSYYLSRNLHGFVELTTVDIPDHFFADKQLRVSGQSVGFFVAPRLKLTSQLTIEPSVRINRQDYTGDKDVSPRFNASLALGRTIIRGAWGIYYQSQGLHQLGIDQGDVFQAAERAEHRVISVEHRLTSGIQLRVEAYQRLLSRIRPHWENLVNVDEAIPEMRFDRNLLKPTRGSAQGVELSAENRVPGRFNWAVSYALSATKETINGVDLPRPRDQRHTLAIDLSYAPNPRWRLSASWQYHTGWPTTEVEFFNSVVTSSDATIGGRLGDPYGLRLPAYHRLDLRLTRLVYMEKSTVRLFLDVFNAYNRKNIQGYTYSPRLIDGTVTTVKRAQGLMGLTPNIGAVWEF